MKAFKEIFDKLSTISTENSDAEIEITKVTLENNNGVSVGIINYGLIITEILVPDRDGVFKNVVLGFENIGDYIERSPYFGAVVGRVAGRIGGAEFSLGGSEPSLGGAKYTLPKNDGDNHLHGNGEFNNAIWDITSLDDGAATFKYVSLDGSNGYPGNVVVTVRYTLNNDNELGIEFEAETDADTPLNLTNHSYFNLTGDVSKDTAGHVLRADIDSFVELREDLIPTGRLVKANGTAFDFTQGRELSSGYESKHEQNIIAGGGYDHALVFAERAERVAVLSDPESGRSVTMSTTYPCFVFYSGNQLSDGFIKHAGVCLEAQYLPDALSNPGFGDIVLKAGEKYAEKTVYKFGVSN